MLGPVVQKLFLLSRLPLTTRMSTYYKEIDPEGDIIISHPTTESKFHLFSRILSLASPVFRAMFSSRYYEGLALAPAVGVVEISLPDDSPRAMAIIFHILHFQNPEVGKEIENEVLYEVALMAEKYELIGALGHWRETWLQTTARDGRKWLSAVYLLSGRKVSNADCWEAVLSDNGMSGGNDEPMGSILPCDLIPEKVFGMIYLIYILIFEIIANPTAEAIFNTRLVAISSLLSVLERFTNLYNSSRIKCRVDQLLPGAGDGGSNCDNTIKGALMWSNSGLGIYPPDIPAPPYRGFSVENLVMFMECIDPEEGVGPEHEACKIGREIDREMSEILAKVKEFKFVEVETKSL